MLIRKEKERDHEGIRRVNFEAFAVHPYNRQTEHLLVGDPAFYIRLGFENTQTLAFEGVPQQFVLAMRWSGPGHHPAFNVAP
jgi:hypothetical protein